MLGAFLLTEPGAGSDASALSTTAIAHGDSWLLNGEKTWVTNATEANVLRVYAQTEPGSGSRGIGAFLVRADQPGVVREEALCILGFRPDLHRVQPWRPGSKRGKTRRPRGRSSRSEPARTFPQRRCARRISRTSP